MTDSTIEVIHNPEKERFEVNADGLMAELVYKKRNNAIYIMVFTRRCT